MSCADIQLKTFVSKMYCKSKEPVNNFVSNWRKPLIKDDTWFLGMYFCSKWLLRRTTPCSFFLQWTHLLLF